MSKTQLEDEVLRLRKLITAKNKALAIFASPDSWKFCPAETGYEAHRTYPEWVWDDPWLNCGTDQSVCIEIPYKFAQCALESE